ncbi:hypothetical protein TNCV_3836301 [Trichonephila clavipes]|nr:hypothetical protein TNCV_3836301 [Trichonephila clavipes]
MKRCFDIHLWISFTPNTAVLFVDVAIQSEVRFIAKQNSLMKIDHYFRNKIAQFESVVQAYSRSPKELNAKRMFVPFCKDHWHQKKTLVDNFKCAMMEAKHVNEFRPNDVMWEKTPKGLLKNPHRPLKNTDKRMVYIYGNMCFTQKKLYLWLANGEIRRDSFHSNDARAHADVRIANLQSQVPSPTQTLSTIQVTVRVGSFPPQFFSPLFPSTNLTRGLVARWLLRVAPCRAGTKHLQNIHAFSPGFEPRPYGTLVSVTNHYTGWVQQDT